MIIVGASEVLPAEAVRDAKLTRLREMLERQCRRIEALEKENRELRDDNIFKASQINVLNIRLEAYSLMQKHESEKTSQANANDSGYTTATNGFDSSRRPFGFDQLALQIPYGMSSATAATTIFHENVITVESHSNISLSYTAERDPRTPFPSEQLLPRLASGDLTEKTPRPEQSTHSSEQVNTSIVMSNRAYMKSYPKHAELPPNSQPPKTNSTPWSSSVH